MRRVLNIAIQGSRWSLVLLTLLALAVSGATAASRQAAMAEAFEEEARAEAVEHPGFDALPDAEEGSQTMAPVGTPNTDECAVLSAVMPGLKLKDDLRSRRLIVIQDSQVTSIPLAKADASVLPTCSSVSSCLGRQFTLVGAKPSGTG